MKGGGNLKRQLIHGCSLMKPRNRLMNFLFFFNLFRMIGDRLSDGVSKLLYHGTLVLCFDDASAGDNPVGSSLRATVDVVQGDAPVELNIQQRVVVAQMLHLRHHVFHELLTAEAGLDRHDENEIGHLDVLLDDIDGSFRLDRESNLHASLANLSANAWNVLNRFDMERVLVHLCVRHVVDPLLRP